ncbi:MAG: glycosyltransferase family 4 protein [Hyphomonadaceae bacterium]|nr:glycosyltransferase family 4 protein [Hyphomonadaceae bacterium]
MPPTTSPRPRTIFVNRFFHPDHSATAQLLSDLALYVAGEGAAVVVVTSRLIYDDPQARLAAREQVGGVEVRRVATTRFGRDGVLGRAADLASFYLSAGWALLRLVRRGDVIVAKTDPPLLSLVAYVVARLKGARLINWLQDIYPEVAAALGVRVAGGPLGRLLAAWRDVTLRAALTNVVLGERMAARLRQRGVPERQITVIPNWSDETQIQPVAHAANPLRTEWGLRDRFVVGYSGNLGRAHEFETMLGAARALALDPRIVFLMIGGGHFSGPLKAAVDAAGLTNVMFKPYQPLSALAQSLCAADIHWVSLNPELEGLIVPSKVYGVLAAGRPVIAVTDVDGEIARLVAAHGCGAHVAPGDVEGFASAVLRLADDPSHAQTLSQAARGAAEGEYSRTAALARWRKALDLGVS